MWSDDLISMITRIIQEELRYAVPRIAQVLKIADDDEEGKILVSIPAFYRTTEELGQWCYPKEKRRLITPKKDDFVIIEWIDGDRNAQAVYSGIAYWMKDMRPKNYDGKETTQILYEDNEQELSIVYDEENKELKINHEDQEYNILLNEDGIGVVDKESQEIKIDTENKEIYALTGEVEARLNQDNKTLIAKAKNSEVSLDGTSQTFSITDGSNTVEGDATTGEINLLGTLINLLGATESFIKGDTLTTALLSLCGTIATATSGTTAQNALGIETIKSAFSTFNGQINNFKSTTLKGE